MKGIVKGKRLLKELFFNIKEKCNNKFPLNNKGIGDVIIW